MWELSTDSLSVSGIAYLAFHNPLSLSLLFAQHLFISAVCLFSATHSLSLLSLQHRREEEREKQERERPRNMQHAAMLRLVGQDVRRIEMFH